MSTVAADVLALDARGATRRLGGRGVLHDVSVDVPRGSLVLVAGPNGAGKSSLVRAIAGRLTLDRGTIAIAGDDAAAARRQGRLGVVPQDIALDPHLTVTENLRLWATIAGTPRRERDARIADGLAWASLADRASARPHELSGGMQRRVNLLAGILHRPSLLVLDEPTVGVDHEGRRLFYRLLDDLRRQDVGVLLVTHEIDDAADNANGVVVMLDGRVVAAGDVATLVRRYCRPGGDLVVRTAPDGPTDVLESTGFQRLAEDAWVREDAGGGDVQALDAELRRRGVLVREIRWRRPSLAAAVATIAAGYRERPS